MSASIQEDLTPGDDKQAYQLYRIAQEAVGNAMRHSGATGIELVWRMENDLRRLSIRDNGIGIGNRKHKASGGMGLQVMLSRAQAINARLMVRDLEKGGTEVLVDSRVLRGGRSPANRQPRSSTPAIRDRRPSLLPVLQDNEPFRGLVAETTGPEREILDDRDILSVLIVPIFVNRTLCGFLGFDDCTTPRKWQNEDVRILQTIAKVTGSTIGRRRATESLERKTEEQRLLLDTNRGVPDKESGAYGRVDSQCRRRKAPDRHRQDAQARCERQCGICGVRGHGHHRKKAPGGGEP